METELKKWVLEMRECDVCVDGDTIKAKATEIYDNIHPATGPVDLYFNDICSKQREAFEASSGWLSNFCRRNSLSYRRITTTGRDLPKNTIDRIQGFYLKVRKY